MNESKALVLESMKRSDAFNGRSLRDLNRLLDALKAWKAEQKITGPGQLKLALDIKTCGKSGLAIDTRARCEELLKNFTDL